MLQCILSLGVVVWCGQQLPLELSICGSSCWESTASDLNNPQLGLKMDPTTTPPGLSHALRISLPHVCIQVSLVQLGKRPALIFLGDVCCRYTLDEHRPLPITSLSFCWILVDLDSFCFQLVWTQMTRLKPRLISDQEKFKTSNYSECMILCILHICLCVYRHKWLV